MNRVKRKNIHHQIWLFENNHYFCTAIKKYLHTYWRDGRVVDCGGLENRWTERFRGFESLFLRRTYWTEMVSERTKSYKSMICGFFYCPKVLLPSDAKECILTICYPISLEYCLWTFPISKHGCFEIKITYICTLKLNKQLIWNYQQVKSHVLK